ncbi:DUF5666 domain-containing protein [Halomonas sp. JS92-SW72]|uniref:DUF5666 domain-containing protein n=1 Tax=Halomonas sp. JS92-SW72 TaxID=2306583 RepID=UPI000E5B38C2|nr:DUF5666 domain-containing protein [Halomonas sp. JS92-SW72]AXY44049.1 DUF1344 domain-containing protein [Halomonas sp. JS92-SW72]
MKLRTRLATIALSTFAVTAHANEVEGHIEAVDPTNRTLMVQGITFEVSDRTDYDDGLRRFEDLEVGQRVEVDFEYRDGRHIATEIELED